MLAETGPKGKRKFAVGDRVRGKDNAPASFRQKWPSASSPFHSKRRPKPRLLPLRERRSVNSSRDTIRSSRVRYASRSDEENRASVVGKSILSSRSLIYAHEARPGARFEDAVRDAAEDLRKQLAAVTGGKA